MRITIDKQAWKNIVFKWNSSGIPAFH